MNDSNYEPKNIDWQKLGYINIEPFCEEKNTNSLNNLKHYAYEYFEHWTTKFRVIF